MTGPRIMKSPDMGGSDFTAQAAVIARALRPNRRTLAKAATLDRLKREARHLFTNVGYFDTTIRDIAKHMGMSTGAVFAHVEDKPGLWRLVMNGPAPSPQLAEEVALVEAQYPGWPWSVRKVGGTYHASLAESGVPDGTPLALGKGDSPASALRDARIWMERTQAGGVTQ